MNGVRARRRTKSSELLANPLLVGALLGALLGLFGAYLYQRRAQEQADAPPLSAAKAVKLGFGVLSLLRQIANLARI
ncbi:MAG: hypothetical protein O3B38_06125 [Chloroflexi bacterium]|nr:hypothetical protein [Chloroflexota bacterium]